MHSQAHGETHDEVEDCDQQPRNGIAFDKLGGAIEGAEERRLFLLLLAPCLGLFVADRTSSKIGIDGELFARHPIEGKPRTDLGHPGRALGDHDEIHDEKNTEHNETQEDVPAHDEHGETLDHATSSARPCVPLADDQFG